MSVGAETLTVNPRLCDSIRGLLLAEVQKLRDDGSGGDLDQNDVIQTDLVVGVLQGQNTLDLVGLDHCFQNILDCGDLASSNVTTSAVGAGNPVSDSKDTTQVVGGMTPLGGKPAVIVIEPADHGTDVESTVDGVQLVGGTRHASTVGNNSAIDNGAKELSALLELQGLQTTAEGVKKNETGSVELNTSH